MDHIGIDVHKKDSQICLLAEGGELIEQRIRTEPERFAAVLGERPRARIVIEASTESEWVARCLEGLGHEVIVADPNFAPMFRHSHAEGEDRPTGRPRPGGGLPARRLPPGASAL
jgi:transposase